jgi:hypothetical protein
MEGHALIALLLKSHITEWISQCFVVASETRGVEQRLDGRLRRVLALLDRLALIVR